MNFADFALLEPGGSRNSCCSTDCEGIDRFQKPFRFARRDGFGRKSTRGTLHFMFGMGHTLFSYIPQVSRYSRLAEYTNGLQTQCRPIGSSRRGPVEQTPLFTQKSRDHFPVASNFWRGHRAVRGRGAGARRSRSRGAGPADPGAAPRRPPPSQARRSPRRRPRRPPRCGPSAERRGPRAASGSCRRARAATCSPSWSWGSSCGGGASAPRPPRGGAPS